MLTKFYFAKPTQKNDSMTAYDAMDILNLVGAFPKISETFILNQLVGQIQSGNAPSIVRRNNPDESFVHDVVHEFELMKKCVHLPGPDGYLNGVQLTIREISRLINSPEVDLKSIAQAFTYKKAAPRRLRDLRYFTEMKNEYDICHAHFGTVAVNFSTGVAQLDAPLIASFYGYDASAVPRNTPQIYDQLFSEADAITCLSEDMRADLIELGCPPELIHKVPLCIDTSRFRPSNDTDEQSDEIHIFTIGRHVEKKGLEYAINAIATLETDISITYTIAGDGPLRERLEQVIDSTDTHNRVTLLGYRPQSEIQERLRSADIFLLPSVTSQDGDKEGTPTALLEAQASGVPVISTTHAGIPEIVADEESGLLVPERDIPAIQSALDRLLHDKKLRDEMGAHGRELMVENHSIETVSTRLNGIYTALQD